MGEGVVKTIIPDPLVEIVALAAVQVVRLVETISTDCAVVFFVVINTLGLALTID